MVEIPQDIAQDATQAAIWSELVADDGRFTEQDVPALRLLCFWHAVAMEAQRQMTHNGKMAIFDPIALKPFTDASGKAPFMVRKSPALAVLKEATAEIRALSDALGLTPAARSRMGAESRPKRDGAKAEFLTLMFSDRAEKERKAADA